MGRRRRSVQDDTLVGGTTSDEAVEPGEEGLVCPSEDRGRIFLAPGEPKNENPKGPKIDLVDGAVVSFSLPAWRRLWYWVDRAGDYEVSGFGEVEVLGPGHLYVPRVFLLKQVCTESETVPDMEAVSALHMGWTEAHEAAVEAAEKTGEPAPEEFLGLWWHSHGKLQPFFSQVDHSTILRLEGEPFMLSVVVNKERKYQARVDVFKPVRAAVLAEIGPDFRLTSEEWETLGEEFEEKYRRKVAATTTTGPVTYVGTSAPTVASTPTLLDRAGSGVSTSVPGADGGWVRPPKDWAVSAMVTWYSQRFHLPPVKAQRAARIRKALDTISPIPYITEVDLSALVEGRQMKWLSKAILDVAEGIPEDPAAVSSPQVVSSATTQTTGVAKDSNKSESVIICED